MFRGFLVPLIGSVRLSSSRSVAGRTFGPQPALDRRAGPPGAGQDVPATGVVALRVEHVQEQSYEVAVGGVGAASPLERAAGAGEIRAVLP